MKLEHGQNKSLPNMIYAKWEHAEHSADEEWLRFCALLKVKNCKIIAMP